VLFRSQVVEVVNKADDAFFLFTYHRATFKLAKMTMVS